MCRSRSRKTRTRGPADTACGGRAVAGRVRVRWQTAAVPTPPASTSSLPARLRRAAGARLDDLAVRRLRTLAERSATGQPVPPELAPAVVTAFGAVAARPDAQLPPSAEPAVVAAFEGLWDRDFEARPPSPAVRDTIVKQFHRLYYHSYERTWKDTRYRGVTIWKCPLDLWLYSEMLHELRPDLIVETGTAFGGSAYYLGDLCDTLGLDARILTIDIADEAGRPEHPRVTYVTASSTDPAVVQQVRDAVPDGGTVLVILDSDHSREHVLDELRAYADVVSVGSYVVVEDTNVNGHPAYPEFGPGPMEAVDAFLAEDDRFVVDEGKEKFFMTFNPRGYLRKTRA
jgi:cephalosporin hydroxylase